MRGEQVRRSPSEQQISPRFPSQLTAMQRSPGECWEMVHAALMFFYESNKPVWCEGVRLAKMAADSPLTRLELVHVVHTTHTFFVLLNINNSVMTYRRRLYCESSICADVDRPRVPSKRNMWQRCRNIIHRIQTAALVQKYLERLVVLNDKYSK